MRQRDSVLLGAYLPPDLSQFVQDEARSKFGGNKSAYLTALLRACQRGEITIETRITIQQGKPEGGQHETSTQ